MGLVLSIDTSAKAASVALTDGTALIAQYFQNTGLTHSRTLLVMVEDILRNTGRTFSDVTQIAVARGPGSFTGIRIGIASANGLAFATDIPVTGVSTLLAAACAVIDEDCVICPVMDARRGEVYSALFRRGNGRTLRLTGDRALPAAQLAAEAKDSSLPYLLLGDGAALCAEVFRAQRVPFRIAPELLRTQCAYGVALAALEDPGGADANYLRAPQAERERQGRQ